MATNAYDAIIVGASFAGLAVARSVLQVHRTVVIHAPTRTVLHDIADVPYGLPRGGPRARRRVPRARRPGREDLGHPRGVAALGDTEPQPTEDRYFMTRTELLDRLDVRLGGRVAGELIFGDVSTGARDDLQRATDMARDMVARYGMSEALGLTTFEAPRQALFLNVPSMAPREYSEETAGRIDAEIGQLLEAAHARVRGTLDARRVTLEALAKRLIEKEVASTTC